jgi:hypothetical protein
LHSTPPTCFTLHLLLNPSLQKSPPVLCELEKRRTWNNPILCTWLVQSWRVDQKPHWPSPGNCEIPIHLGRSSITELLSSRMMLSYPAFFGELRFVTLGARKLFTQEGPWSWRTALSRERCPWIIISIDDRQTYKTTFEMLNIFSIYHRLRSKVIVLFCAWRSIVLFDDASSETFWVPYRKKIGRWHPLKKSDRRAGQSKIVQSSSADRRIVLFFRSK